MKHVITTLFVMVLLSMSANSFAQSPCKSLPRMKLASTAAQPCVKADEAEKKSPTTKQRFQIPTARRFGVVRYS